MPEVELIEAVPVLNVTDLARSLVFYRDNLGFSLAFEVPQYAGVKRGQMTIHLDALSHEFSSRPTCCRFHIRGVDALYAEVEPLGIVKVDEQLVTNIHGMRQFSILDPDGNRITFAQPMQ